jgi:hypothetical protein
MAEVDERDLCSVKKEVLKRKRAADVNAGIDPSSADLQYFTALADLLERERYRQDELEEKKIKLRSMEVEVKLEELKLNMKLLECNRPISPKSPALTGSVYVLCDSDNPVGTAFAVTSKDGENRIALTAFHNIDVPTRGRLTLVEKIERSDTGGLVMNGVITVSLIGHDKCLDWAILQRDDLTPFPEPITIETQRPVVEDYLKLYHCPVLLFNDGLLNFIESTPENWTKVGFVRPPIITVDTGAFGGSSGGVFVNKFGNAVALFLSSVNTCKTSGTARAIALSCTQMNRSIGEGLLLGEVQQIVALCSL